VLAAGAEEGTATVAATVIVAATVALAITAADTNNFWLLATG